MEPSVLKNILDVGETIGVEFKRCGNGIEMMFMRLSVLS